MNHLPLALVGVDFRRAATRHRAALAMDEAACQALMTTLRGHGVSGLVVLETCNRTEWLVASERTTWVAQLLEAHMVHCWQQAGFDGPAPKPYRFEGEDSVRHLFRVAAGLESFVLGERQVAGQLQRAFESARAAQRSCSTLNVLGSWSGRVVRKLQRRGAHGAESAGVELLALEAVRRRCGQHARIGVVGLGEIGQRCVHLFAQRGHSVQRYNRSPGVRGALPLEAIAEHCEQLDALVVATGARTAWLERAHLGAQLPVIVDIGSPQQVTASLADAAETIDLDALLVGQRPVDQHRREALEGEVELGLADFRLSEVRRGLRHVVEQNQRTYEELAYARLPEALEGLGEVDPKEVEAKMRSLLRDYSRAVLRAVEDSSEAS